MKEKMADTVAEHLRATSDKGVQELDNLIHQRLRSARTLTDNLMPRCALRCGPGSAGGQSTTGAKELRVHRDCATQERQPRLEAMCRPSAMLPWQRPA